MAIRISHASIKDVATAGTQAGQAQREVMERKIQVQQQADTRRQQVQMMLAQKEMNFRIEQARTDDINRMETMKFQSFMGEEAKRRDMAFEYEKVEMRNRHDFEMIEANKEAQNQYTMQKEFRATQKTDAQKKALDDAHAQGRITDDDLYNEKLRIDLGISGSQSKLYQRARSGDGNSAMYDVLFGGAEEGKAAGNTAALKRDPIIQDSPTQGSRVSYDGGATWKPYTE